MRIPMITLEVALLRKNVFEFPTSVSPFTSQSRLPLHRNRSTGSLISVSFINTFGCPGGGCMETSPISVFHPLSTKIIHLSFPLHFTHLLTISLYFPFKIRSLTVVSFSYAISSFNILKPFFPTLQILLYVFGASHVCTKLYCRVFVCYDDSRPTPPPSSSQRLLYRTRLVAREIADRVVYIFIYVYIIYR